MRINKHKLVIAVLAVSIYFALDHSYLQAYKGNYFEFEKFALGSASTLKVVVSYLIPLGLTYLLVVLPTSEFIYAVLSFVLVVSIYPASILLRNLNSDSRILILQLIYFLSIFLIGNHFKIRVKSPILKESQKTNALFFLSLTMAMPFVWIYARHIDYSNLLLENIYESRATEAQHSNLYTAYAYSPLTNVLMPLLLLLSLYHREYFKTAVGFFLLIFMFLVGGHKAVFFGVFALIVFYHGNYYAKVRLAFSGILVLLLACIAFYHFFEDLYLTSLVSRRIFFLPAILEIGYFKFFDSHHIYWSDSILRTFIQYPYSVPPQNLIGEYVLANVDTNANNGIISDGFMNFGVAGSLLNILFVSVIYSIMNSLHLNHKFFGLVLLMLLTFYSSYFFTSLITHGILFFILVSYVFLKDTDRTYGH